MKVRIGHIFLAMWLLGPVPMAQAQVAQQATGRQVQTADYADLMNQTANAIRIQNWAGAQSSGKAAFRAAASDNERLNAARLVASAHFRAGQFVRAEWWLRRALNNASEGPGAQVVRQDFALVRQANPLTVRLSFSAAPNNNINNGSSAQNVTLFNLPFILSADAQALSGFEVSGSVDLRYRLAQSPEFATDIGLLLYGRTYELSRAAAAAAPGVRGADYAFSVAEVLLSHSRNFAGLPGPTTFSLNLGKNWYGGDPYTRYGRLTVAQQVQVSDRSVAKISAGLERQKALSRGIQTDILTLAGGLDHRLANNDVVGVSLRLQQGQSADPGSESVATQLGLSYGIARPVMGMAWSFSLSAEKRDFDFSIYDMSGRQDVTLSAAASVAFVNFSYFGFSPTASLEANRTASNIDLFDRETLALRVGLRSAF